MNQTEINLRRIRAYNRTLDAWKEDEHPRDKNGRFKSGAGESKTSKHPLQKLANATKIQEREGENERFPKKVGGENVDKAYITSAAYKEKYNSLDLPKAVKQTLWKKSMDMLFHRSGTDYEDMYLVNRYTGATDAAQTQMDSWGDDEKLRHLGIEYTPEMEDAIAAHPRKTYYTIHNHPNNSPPSGNDFEKAFEHGYAGGYISCHDGTLYYYEVGDHAFTALYFDSKVAKIRDKMYNDGVSEHKGEEGFYHQCECKARETVMDTLVNDYGIRWWKK